MTKEGKLWKDIRLWLVIALAVLGAIGVIVEEMTWAEAGGVIGIVVAAYIGAAAVERAIVQLATK